MVSFSVTENIMRGITVHMLFFRCGKSPPCKYFTYRPDLNRQDDYEGICTIKSTGRGRAPIDTALRMVSGSKACGRWTNLIISLKSWYFFNTLKNKSGLFSCQHRILDYFSDILFTFSTTFILITKLKSLSVLNLSVRLSVCLSVCLSTIFLTSSWHSEHLL